MKDSRIGTFGGLALILATLIRASAYGALFAHPAAGVFAVLGSGALSRLAMTALWGALPNARPGRPRRTAWPAGSTCRCSRGQD